MKLFTNVTEKLTTAISLGALLVGLTGVFAFPRLAEAASLCYGGSVIRNSTGTIIGCGFSTYGPPQQAMCAGAVVFGPSTGGPGTCTLCVQQAYAAQVAAQNFSGLTIAPNAGNSGPTSFTCLQCAQPPAGMTGWWTMDDAATGTVADITGTISASGLLINNPLIVPGEVAGALNFNGVNQYVEMPDDPQLNIPAAAADGSGDFSFDAWVKLDPTGQNSGVRVIAEKRTFNSPNHYKGYSFYLYNRYLGLQLADDGSAPGYTNYGAPTLVVPADGAWHFVAVSVSRKAASSVQFTLDGLPAVVISSVRPGSFANSSPLRLGSVTIGVGSVFGGSIDEVEFFRRAVPSSDWLTIYNAKCNGKCRPQ